MWKPYVNKLTSWFPLGLLYFNEIMKLFHYLISEERYGVHKYVHLEGPTTLWQFAATCLSGILANFPAKQSFWSVVSLLFQHPFKQNDFPGWHHRPPRSILLITRQWTTVVHIFEFWKFTGNQGKIIRLYFSPMWS